MMDALGGLGMAFLQDDSTLQALQHDVHLQMIFTGIVAVVVLVGFIGIGVAGLIALKLVRKAEELAERMEGKITPMAEKTHELVTQLGPKVRTITENVEQISYTVRGKVDEISVTVSEINKTVQDVNGRTQKQVAHVDRMVGEALDTAHNVSRTVQEGVRRPVQQIAGIVAGVRAGVETLLERSPFLNRTRRAEARAEEAVPYESPVRYQGPGPTVTQQTTAYGTVTETVSGSGSGTAAGAAGSFKRTGPYDL